MHSFWRPVCLLALLPLSIIAQTPQRDPVPLKHWAAPQYFQIPPRPEANAVTTVPLTFIALPPCRLADTRAGSGFPALGSTPFTANMPQTLSIAGSCGTPTSPVALAYSLNVSVVPPAASKGGYLTAYPNPTTPPPTAASLTWNPGASYDTNAVAVEASSDGSVNLIVNMSTDVVVDINGYYTAQPSRNASLVFNANAMTAFPGSGSATVLQTTIGTGQNVFPITAFAIKPSSSVNLMLTFNVPIDLSTASPPVIHVHFLTGPGTAGLGSVVLPLNICSVPAVTNFPGNCFVRYPNATVAFDTNSSGFTFNHYDLTYTLSGYSFGTRPGLYPGDFVAVTIGRSTTDTFADSIYVTSVEFAYPTN